MRTKNFSPTYVLAIAVVMVMICIIATGSAVYGFFVDLATSPITVNFVNAYEKSVDLQHDVESAYPAESIIIQYEKWPDHRSQILAVTLVNSVANPPTAEEQRIQAERIARLIWQNNKVNAEVRSIKITFVRRTGFLGIPLCHGDSYRFQKADLMQE